MILSLQDSEWSNDFLQSSKNKENMVVSMNYTRNNISKHETMQHDLDQQWASEYLQDIPLTNGKNIYLTTHISLSVFTGTD